MSHAERLQADFPDATLRTIADAATYVMLDQPDDLARAIDEFIAVTSK
jgi:pimeloyl-ACP methyl ester carboxylesterase